MDCVVNVIIYEVIFIFIMSEELCEERALSLFNSSKNESHAIYKHYQVHDDH